AAPPKPKSFGAITKHGTLVSPSTYPTPPSGTSNAVSSTFVIPSEARGFCGRNRGTRFFLSASASLRDEIFSPPRVHLPLSCPLSQFPSSSPPDILYSSQSLLRIDRKSRCGHGRFRQLDARQLVSTRQFLRADRFSLRGDLVRRKNHQNSARFAGAGRR